jgi:putative transposase
MKALAAQYLPTAARRAAAAVPAAAAARPRPRLPATANFAWAYDFVFDAYADGQKIKCLPMVDEHTRERLAIDVAGSILSHRLVGCLPGSSAPTAHRAICARITGPEFVSRALLEWLPTESIEQR